MPLLSVLWGIALLSLVAVSLLGTSGTSRKLASNAVAAAQAEATAEAAVVLSAVALSDPRAERRWHADGRPEHFSLAGMEATVTIQDELGRIDLNYADRGLLFGLFRSVGVEAEPANQLTEAILEWRAPVGAQIEGGTNDGGAASEFMPRHGLFQSVDELRLVPGMTPALFRRVAPALTVYSQRQSIDPQLAPREALLALPAMTADSVADQLASRTTSLQSSSSMQLPLSGRAFALRIDVAGSGGVRRYEAAIRFTEEPGKLYWLLDWRERMEPPG